MQAAGVALQQAGVGSHAVRSFGDEVDGAISEGMWVAALELAVVSDDPKLVSDTVSRLNEHRDAVIGDLTNRSNLALVKSLGPAIGSSAAMMRSAILDGQDGGKSRGSLENCFGHRPVPPPSVY